MALCISSDRKYVATGQLGSTPLLFIWNCSDCQLKTKWSKAKLPKGTRGITAVSISYNGKYVACSDNHNDHNVYVYEIN